MAEPYYSTATALRSELDVDDQTLTDADAIKIIEIAEDLIDDVIRGRATDTVTGRRVAEADIESWQWTKLERATTLLAADIYNDPDVAEGRRWGTVAGPDFRFANPRGSELPNRVMVILRQTGLVATLHSVPLSGGRGSWDEPVIGNR